LRLAGVRAAAPGFELEALRHARQRREEDIEFGADIRPLARREPGNLCSVRLGHVGYWYLRPARAETFHGPQYDGRAECVPAGHAYGAKSSATDSPLSRRVTRI